MFLLVYLYCSPSRRKEFTHKGMFSRILLALYHCYGSIHCSGTGGGDVSSFIHLHYTILNPRRMFRLGSDPTFVIIRLRLKHPDHKPWFQINIKNDQDPQNYMNKACIRLLPVVNVK